MNCWLGEFKQLTFPPDAYTDKDIGDEITYDFEQMNGSPLPQWIRFFPMNNTIVM